jgi:tRNA (adenine22-N1)-methyltransferase
MEHLYWIRGINLSCRMLWSVRQTALCRIFSNIYQAGGIFLELTKRLAAIAEFIPQGMVVADVGTDHALLPICLVQAGRIPMAIATDLNEKPYLGACQAVSNRGLNNIINVRLGSGLEPLCPGEAEIIVISGMGGSTIISILEGSAGVLANTRRLILQPMADAGRLRLWLAGNGWRLADEKLVREEGRIYPVLVAEPGEEPEKDKMRLEIGPRLLDKGDPLLKDYLDKIKSDYQKVLSGLARSRSIEAREKAIMLTKKFAAVRGMLYCKQNVK